MKKAKNEQIRNAVTQYMKRRHYLESEIHGGRPAGTQLDTMSVRKRAHLSAGVQNSVAASSISGDFTSCDQQFARFRQFVLESSPGQSEELSALQFPVFVHMYCDLLAAGQKASAQRFHERHNEVFHAEDQKDVVRSLCKLQSKADLMAATHLVPFREHRYTVRLSHPSITHLLTHLKAADNMIILQIINQHVNLIGTDTQGKSLELQAHSGYSAPCREASRPPEQEEKREVKAEDPSQPDPPPDVSPSVPQLTWWEREEVGRLREVSDKLEAAAPPLPSILFCTVINSSAHQGLCTSSVSESGEFLSGGFEDSSVGVYRLQPVALPAAPTDCSNSFISLAADHGFTHTAPTHLDAGSEEGVWLRAHSGPVYKTLFTPDSNYLLSCSRDCTVRLWDIITRSNTNIYRGHSGPVWDMDYSPVTNHLVTSSRDLTVKLWSLDRVYPLRSFIGHELDIQAVAIHPNGNYVATGSADRTVRLWSVQDGKCLRTLCGHRGAVLALAFTLNGLNLASAGDDRRIHIWDLNSGQVLKELRGHTDTVHCLAFSPCGHILASGGLDCVLRLWDLRPGALHDRSAVSQTEGYTSSELMGAYPTKSSTVTCLSFLKWHLLYAVGANQ